MLLNPFCKYIMNRFEWPAESTICDVIKIHLKRKDERKFVKENPKKRVG